MSIESGYVVIDDGLVATGTLRSKHFEVIISTERLPFLLVKTRFTCGNEFYKEAQMDARNSVKVLDKFWHSETIVLKWVQGYQPPSK